MARPTTRNRCRRCGRNAARPESRGGLCCPCWQAVVVDEIRLGLPEWVQNGAAVALGLFAAGAVFTAGVDEWLRRRELERRCGW